MPQGLEIWNADGLLTHSITTRLPKKFGQITIGEVGSPATGSVTGGRYQLVQEGKASFFYMLIALSSSGDILGLPAIGLVGQNVTWTWPTSERMPFSDYLWNFVMDAGIEVFDGTGSFLQFDQDSVIGSFVSKHLINTRTPITISSVSSLVVETDASIVAMVALRAPGLIGPYYSQLNTSTNKMAHWFVSSLPVDTPVACYVFDMDGKTVTTRENFGLEVFEPNGIDLTYSSAPSWVTLAGIAPMGLSAGRLYATVCTGFSGSRVQTYHDADETAGDPHYSQRAFMQRRASISYSPYQANVGDIDFLSARRAGQVGDFTVPPKQVLVVDVTNFGGFPDEITYELSLTPQAASQQAQQTPNQNFGPFTVNFAGAGGITSYNWIIDSPENGTFAISSGQGTAQVFVSMTGATEGLLAKATLFCDIVVNGQARRLQSLIYYENYGAPDSFQLALNPGSESSSGDTASYNFPQTLTVTNGSATSYSWSLSNASGGVWSISSGQGTASVMVSVSGVARFSTANATLSVTVVVNGQTRVRTAELSWFYQPLGTMD